MKTHAMQTASSQVPSSIYQFWAKVPRERENEVQKFQGILSTWITQNVFVLDGRKTYEKKNQKRRELCVGNQA